jgi:hypothetical protein
MPNYAEVCIGDKEITIALNEKTFKTKSTGYHGQAKLDLGNGERYQIQIHAVLIGSKPNSGQSSAQKDKPLAQ